MHRDRLFERFGSAVVQVRTGISHAPQRRGAPFLSRSSLEVFRDHLQRLRIRSGKSPTLYLLNLHGIHFGDRVFAVGRSGLGNEDSIVTGVATVRPHVMDQQVAEDAGHVTQLLSVTRGAADLREESFAVLQRLAHSSVVCRGCYWCG